MKISKLSLLATCLGVCCFFNAVQGMEDKLKGSEAVCAPKTAAQILEESGRLSTADAQSFAEFAYYANQTGEKGTCNKLINAGWVLHPLSKTADAADHQLESVSGFVAFKGHHVVIAIRGDEANTTGQDFWESILNYTEKSKISVQDMRFTVTGHSLGGAKPQSNALWLAQMLGFEGKKNIEVIVFGSSRVFDTTMAEQVEETLGDSIFCIENDPDLIDISGNISSFLSLGFWEFKHVGLRIRDNDLLKLVIGNMSNSNAIHCGSNTIQKADTLRAARLVALES